VSPVGSDGQAQQYGELNISTISKAKFLCLQKQFESSSVRAF